MLRKSVAHRSLVALMLFSMILSMTGMVSPAAADTVNGEGTPVSTGSGDASEPGSEPLVPDDDTGTDLPPETGNPAPEDEGNPDGEDAGTGEDPASGSENPDQNSGDDAANQNDDADSESDEDTNQSPQDDGEDTASSRSTVGTTAIETSTVTIVVEMTDGGPVPSGLQATVYPSGDWTPIEILPVTGGDSTATVTFATDFPYGSYGVWVTGNGYSSGVTANFDEALETYTFRFDRLTGTLDITVTTTDGADVPAGTSWTLSHAQDGVVASDVLASPLPSGSALPVPFTSLAFGMYELSFMPDSAATGPQVAPITRTIDMTNTWVTSYAIDVPLEVVVPMGTVSLSVEMLDGGEIPDGLQWSLVGPDSWDPIAAGPVTAGDVLFEHTLPEGVPYGQYSLWITGNGYSSGQVINVYSETVSHGFGLDRLHGNLTVTVTTNDGADIPAGTAWEILDVNGTILQSGALATALPSGTVLALDNPFEFGVYTLNIGPGTDTLVPMALADLPRELLPFSTTINITNPWFSEYPITAELQWAESDVTFSVSMTDGGPLPNGLEWMLVVSGSWDPLASGQVSAGENIFAGEIGEPVPYGVYQLWISGNGYSSGQVLNIQNLTTHHDVVLDRLTGNVTITFDTSDDAAVPVGTTWSITDSAGMVVQEGELADAVPDGGTLAITNPLEFDIYTLAVDADGYHPFTMELNVTNPWASEYAFTAVLQQELSQITFTVSMSDGGPLPNGLEWSLVPNDSWNPLDLGDIPAGVTIYAGEVGDPVPYGVYQLWITGNGYSSGQVLNITSVDTHHDFVLDRLLGEVTITLDTSDDAAVPAGTTWSIIDSAGTVVQEGVLTQAIADGGTLPITNPLEFDVYTLVIEAEGYHPLSLVMDITNPWVSEYAFVANLVSNVEPEPAPTETPGPGPDSTVPPVTQLPQTGAGEGVSGMTIMLLSLSTFALAAAAIGGRIRMMR